MYILFIHIRTIIQRVFTISVIICTLYGESPLAPALETPVIEKITVPENLKKESDKEPIKELKKILIIIFIHGTVKPPEFPFSSIFKIMRDEVDNTLYQHAVHYMRHDNHFFNGQAMQELGLHQISQDPKDPHTTARTVSLLYNLQFEALGKNTNDIVYYTFGWDGLLSASKRYIAAQNLYHSLLQEVARLKKDGIEPTIMLVGFSHGGNVALYLPAVRAEHALPSLQIETLITIATPVQEDTDHCICDSLFKEIYHIYSSEDRVQKSDFFSSHSQYFSHRTFRERHDFPIPTKLKQIQFRLTKKIKHRNQSRRNTSNDVSPHTFLADDGLRFSHRDPGHTEMWCFEWGAYWYRPKFPLNPIPVMGLVPTIIHTVNTYYPERSHIILDYVPEYHGALLYDKKIKRKAVPFLTPILKEKLWDIADKYQPNNFSVNTQKQHTAKALEKAKFDLMKIRKYRRPHSRTLATYMKRINSGYFDDLPEFQEISKSHLLGS